MNDKSTILLQIILEGTDYDFAGEPNGPIWFYCQPNMFGQLLNMMIQFCSGTDCMGTLMEALNDMQIDKTGIELKIIFPSFPYIWEE